MGIGLDFLIFIPFAIASIAFLFSIFLSWYSTRNNDYWSKRGVPFAKPFPFYYFLEYLWKGFENVDCERYTKYGKVHGFYEGTTPQITVGDPKLLKNIFVKDFHNFTNKRVPKRYVIMGCKGQKTGYPLVDKFLTLQRGEDWKRIRNIVSPTFSTVRIKRAMSVFQDSAKILLRNMKMELEKASSVEMGKMYGAFTLDVISCSAFSAKVDCLNNPGNAFVKIAKSITTPSLTLKMILSSIAPKITSFLGFHVFSSEYTFFQEVVLELIEKRRETGQTRNDFLQLLMDTAEESLKKEKLDETTDDYTDNYRYDTTSQSDLKGNVSKHLSMDELVAQCVMFFLGGYHTTATALTMTTYLLTVHQVEQEKVFQEIKDILRETKGVLTYEAVQKMTYLDNVISEALRIYPPAPRVEREAEADYELGDTGITVPKGMVICIPIFSMHRDPNFFPEPEKFNPNRFSPEGKKTLIPYTFIPFGSGPRNCVALRFALMQLKVCLIHVFSVFHLQKSPETKEPLGRGKGLLSPNPIRVYLEERKDCPLIL